MKLTDTAKRAHRDRNNVHDAYNRSARLAERARMMQAWADYLDKLRLNEPANDAERVDHRGRLT